MENRHEVLRLINIVTLSLQKINRKKGILMKIKKVLRILVNSLLGLFGLVIYKANSSLKKQNPRHSLKGTLEQIKRLGFEPNVVIDVGVAEGTPPLYEAFPNAKHFLIEPIEEFKPYLDKIVNRLKNAEYIFAVATKSTSAVTINVHPDLFGSSTYIECENSNVNGIPRTVDGITLDEVCKKRRLIGPYLIKIDVQGAELDVLTGANQILKETEYIIIEISLLGFYLNGPQLYDVITFMKEHGFVVYDILDYQYRPLDGAMSQVDMAFVKELGQFRKYHYYATKEQRKTQNEKLRKPNKNN